MTQAVILAAGRGSRMLEFTQDKPKCLIKLAEKTLLEWQSEALKNAGIEDIFIVGGYLAEVLESSHRYKSFFNPLWNQTNMLESLYCAKEILNRQETIISYSDIVYHSQTVKTLLQSSGDVVITYDLLWKNLWQERFSNPLEDAETFLIQDGELIEIGKSPTNIQEVQGQYMGLLKITPIGWSAIVEKLQSLTIERRKKMDMTTFLQYLIDSKIRVNGVPVFGKWCEVDSPNDLKCYEKKLQEKKPWTHDWTTPLVRCDFRS